MQLRKVISLRGEKPVEFDNREKLKLTPKDAQILIAKIKKIKRPRDKQNMVRFLMKNAKNLKDVLAGKKVETDPEVIRQKALSLKSEDINEAFEAIVEIKEDWTMERMGITPDLVDAVRDVLMGKRPVEVDEGDKEEYQKFFQAALKKFGVGSPAEFKSDEEKKKFFDYIEKNWTKDEK